MDVTSIKQIRQTIRSVRHRRNRILHTKNISWCLTALLGIFVFFVFLTMFFQPGLPVRIVLFALFAAALGGIGWQAIRTIRRLDSDDRRLAHYVDEHIPELEQRFLTAVETYENQGETSSSQMAEALWQDTARHLQDQNIQEVTGSRPAWYAAGTAMVLICFLAIALLDSERFSGAARQVLWPWSSTVGPMSQSADLLVSPGDILIRRGSDVTVSARMAANRPEDVFLYLQSAQGGWNRVRMQAEDASLEYLHYLSGVQKDTTYYVATGAMRSEQYRIRVFDLIRIESIDVSYFYPEHTGLEDKTEKDGGDIIAPEGTRVRLDIGFSRPVQKGVLKFDDGSTLDLTPGSKNATGSFVVEKDGTYIVHASDDAGRKVENQAEYTIQSIPDSPPEFSVSMPGKDLKVMALEEVTINASAKDDFGLTKFTLNYSVAGKEAQTVSLLEAPGRPVTTAVDGNALLYLEDMQVSPGDFVTYYLTAADNNGIRGPAEAISDIYFLEVIRTDEEFRRASGQSGGGGQAGQGQRQSALVENQKNIIAATWKLLKRKKQLSGETFAEELNIVAESQQQLMQRTQMSLSRLVERFSFADESFDQAVIHLFEAVTAMQAAAENLFGGRLKEALGPEQAALQAILKAEAQSRRSSIQMARNRSGAAGGDDQNREREDLRELFEMEMGRLENRYEMPAVAAGSESAEQEDVLKRLRELAKRQERLNRAQMDADRRREKMSEEQRRRRLEELRREQEKLQRQAGALAQRLSRQGASGRSASRSLERAAEQMREAANSLKRRDSDAAADSGRKALQNLRTQEQNIARRHVASLSELAKGLNEKADRLQSQENEIVQSMERMRNQKNNAQSRTDRDSSPGDREMAAEIVAQKERLQAELDETRKTLAAIGAKGRQSDPELSRRALQTLRSPELEGLEQRIEKSKAGLQKGDLNDAADLEKEISRSINRFARRLRDFHPGDSRSDPERIEQAAENAEALARELESMQMQAESLSMQQTDSIMPRRGQNRSSSADGSDPSATLSQLRDGFGRSRKHARALTESWARGEGWAIAARSLYRELSQKEIEDFINQPELWQSLLGPARELASRLRAQTEAGRLKERPFSTSQQAPPEPYKSQVESYFRSLSELTKKQEVRIK